MQTVTKIFLSISFFMLFSACNKKDNHLTVSVDKFINKQDIKIKMEVLASIPVTEIYDGKKQWEIPNGYGENEWYFTYKDTLHGYLRHIKTNRNDNHAYKFTFYKEDERYFVDVSIKGDSPLQQIVELKVK